MVSYAITHQKPKIRSLENKFDGIDPVTINTFLTEFSVACEELKRSEREANLTHPSFLSGTACTHYRTGENRTSGACLLRFNYPFLYFLFFSFFDPFLVVSFNSSLLVSFLFNLLFMIFTASATGDPTLSPTPVFPSLPNRQIIAIFCRVLTKSVCH